MLSLQQNIEAMKEKLAKNSKMSVTMVRGNCYMRIAEVCICCCIDIVLKLDAHYLFHRLSRGMLVSRRGVHF